MLTTTLPRMAKKKPGRPKKKGEKYDQILYVKAKRSQKEQWQQAAEDAGMDFSAWVRMILGEAMKATDEEE